ncbi:hypothetical protein ACJ73_02558 [Blastomyces percursus]|uniref:Uncharacterized protein n=1 Tax=Blastomyces percursus TaxID=1658174 RepID=A0A1J9RDK3_9EURO|nr:hypothetical protein ACJ73_02558 [Blastomyces percursus]
MSGNPWISSRKIRVVRSGMAVQVLLTVLHTCVWCYLELSRHFRSLMLSGVALMDQGWKKQS